jgi:hypothetical protein
VNLPRELLQFSRSAQLDPIEAVEIALNRAPRKIENIYLKERRGWIPISLKLAIALPHAIYRQRQVMPATIGRPGRPGRQACQMPFAFTLG